jgi:hypothetical protein
VAERKLRGGAAAICSKSYIRPKSALMKQLRYKAVKQTALSSP